MGCSLIAFAFDTQQFAWMAPKGISCDVLINE